MRQIGNGSEKRGKERKLRGKERKKLGGKEKGFKQEKEDEIKEEMIKNLNAV